MAADFIWAVMAVIVIAGLVIFNLPWTLDQKLSAVTGGAVLLLTFNSLWYDRHNLNIQRIYQEIDALTEIGGADRGALIALVLDAQTQVGSANPAWFTAAQPLVNDPAFQAYWSRNSQRYDTDTQQTVVDLQTLNTNNPTTPALQPLDTPILLQPITQQPDASAQPPLASQQSTLGRSL